jgi:hypothetical protein
MYWLQYDPPYLLTLLPCFPRSIQDKDGPIFLMLRNCLNQDQNAIVPSALGANLEEVECMVHVRTNGFSMKAVKQRQCLVDINQTEGASTVELLCKRQDDGSGLMNEARLCLATDDDNQVSLRSGGGVEEEEEEEEEKGLLASRACLTDVNGVIGLRARRCLRHRSLSLVGDEIEFLPCLASDNDAPSSSSSSSSSLELTQCLADSDGEDDDDEEDPEDVDVSLESSAEGDHLCLAAAGEDGFGLSLQLRVCHGDDGQDDTLELIPCAEAASGNETFTVNAEGVAFTPKRCEALEETVMVRSGGVAGGEGDLIVDQVCLVPGSNGLTLRKRECLRSDDLRIDGIDGDVEFSPCFQRAEDATFTITGGGAPLQISRCLSPEASRPSLPEPIFLGSSPPSIAGNRRFLCLVSSDEGGLQLEQRECSLLPSLSETAETLPCIPVGSSESLFVLPQGRQMSLRNCKAKAEDDGEVSTSVVTFNGQGNQGDQADGLEARLCLSAVASDRALAVKKRMCLPGDAFVASPDIEIVPCLQHEDHQGGFVFDGLMETFSPAGCVINNSQEETDLTPTMVTLSQLQPVRGQRRFLCLVNSADDSALGITQRECSLRPSVPDANSELLPCAVIGGARSLFLGPNGLSFTLRSCSKSVGQDLGSSGQAPGDFSSSATDDDNVGPRFQGSNVGDDNGSGGSIENMRDLLPKICLSTDRKGQLALTRKTCLPGREVVPNLRNAEILPCMDTIDGDGNTVTVSIDTIELVLTQCIPGEDDQRPAEVFLARVVPARGQRRFLCAATMSENNNALGLAQRECSLRTTAASEADPTTEVIPCLALGAANSLVVPSSGRALRLRSCKSSASNILRGIIFPGLQPLPPPSGASPRRGMVEEKLCLDTADNEQGEGLHLKKRVCLANASANPNGGAVVRPLGSEETEPLLCLSRNEEERFVIGSSGSATALAQCFVGDISAGISDEELVLDASAREDSRHLCLASADDGSNELLLARKTCLEEGQNPLQGGNFDFLPCMMVGDGGKTTLSAEGASLVIRQCMADAAASPGRQPLLGRANSQDGVIRLDAESRACLSPPRDRPLALALETRSCVNVVSDTVEDNEELVPCLGDQGLSEGSLELFSCSIRRPNQPLNLEVPKLQEEAFPTLDFGLTAPSLCMSSKANGLTLESRRCGKDPSLFLSDTIVFLPCLPLPAGGGNLLLAGSMDLVVSPCLKEEGDDGTEDALCLDESMAPRLGVLKRRCFPVDEVGGGDDETEQARCLSGGAGGQEGVINVMDLVDNPLETRQCLLNTDDDEYEYYYTDEDQLNGEDGTLTRSGPEEEGAGSSETTVQPHICFLKGGRTENRPCFPSSSPPVPSSMPTEMLFCRASDGQVNLDTFTARGPQPSFVSCLKSGRGDDEEERLKVAALLGATLGRILDQGGDACNLAQKAVEELQQSLKDLDDEMGMDEMVDMIISMDGADVTSFAGVQIPQLVERAVRCIVQLSSPDIFTS